MKKNVIPFDVTFKENRHSILGGRKLQVTQVGDEEVIGHLYKPDGSGLQLSSIKAEVNQNWINEGIAKGLIQYLN